VRRNLFLIGVMAFVAGVGLRFLPSAADPLSLLSALLVVTGFVLLLVAVLRRWGRIKGWSRGSPVGKHVLAIGGIFTVILAAWVFRSAQVEVSLWIRAGPIKSALSRDDPLAALDLADFLRHEAREHAGERGSAVLRTRIAERLGELGNPSRDVTTILRESLLADPDDEVRGAVAKALGRLMSPWDALACVLEMPKLSAAQQATVARSLAAKAGKDLGASPDAWLDWFMADWGGAEVSDAFLLAVDAYRALAARPDRRAVCLARIRDGSGAGRPGIERLLGDSDPKLREAVAMAAARKGESSWVGPLESALKKEKEADPAARIVDAIVKLEPDGGLRILLDAARSAPHEPARAAALPMLSAQLGISGTEDRALLTAAVYRRLPPGGAKKETLEDLARMARESETARNELLLISKAGAEAGLARSAAMKAVLDSAPALLPSEDLVEMLEGDVDPEFAQNVREELRKRTGMKRDGGTDPKVWREILEQLK
jgi:hypothetical protein